MTIPGLGDLSPPRRQVPIGRWVVMVLVLALLVGGGYAAFLGLSGGSPTPSASKLPLCPPPTKLAPIGKAGPLRLIVKNSTQRVGLAAEVAADLENRSFHVVKIGNTIVAGKGVATVRYSADRRLVADHVAAQIKGSTLVVAGGHGVVELDIGPKFHALLTPRKAKIAYRQLVARPAPSSTPGGTCRPRPLASTSG